MRKDIANAHDETPLQPAGAFPMPGTDVVLYEGPIGGLTDNERAGRIVLNCGPRPGLRWCAELKPGDVRLELGALALTVRRHGRAWAIDAHERSGGEGWIGMAAFGRPDARLTRVMVNWMNLPEIAGPIGLFEADGEVKNWWRGRWRTEVDGWQLTLDSRPDYHQALAHARETRLYVFTHVMEIRRSDDSSFSIDGVMRLLECLRVTFSFAFGRWVAPVLPFGYDQADNVAWEMWTSPICDPAKTIGSPPIYRGRPQDVTDIVQCAVHAFNNPSSPGNTRFQMCLAIQAVEAGFVEQRILAAAPALEHLAWCELVLANRWTREDYEARQAEDRLRYVLQLANIPTHIDPGLPALTKFARNQIDGPTAITRVRNRLIHPPTPDDQIYKHDGLVQDTWQLSRRYLTLLLLRSIGYQGQYLDPVRATGWEGTTKSVPWDTTTPIPTPAMPQPRKTRHPKDAHRRRNLRRSKR